MFHYASQFSILLPRHQYFLQARFFWRNAFFLEVYQKKIDVYTRSFILAPEPGNGIKTMQPKSHEVFLTLHDCAVVVVSYVSYLGGS